MYVDVDIDTLREIVEVPVERVVEATPLGWQTQVAVEESGKEGNVAKKKWQPVSTRLLNTICLMNSG